MIHENMQGDRMMESYHRGKHAPVTPHVKTVVIFLEVDEQFGTFKVPRGYADIVLRCGMVKLGKTPVDKP